MCPWGTKGKAGALSLFFCLYPVLPYHLISTLKPRRSVRASLVDSPSRVLTLRASRATWPTRAHATMAISQ